MCRVVTLLAAAPWRVSPCSRWRSPSRSRSSPSPGSARRRAALGRRRRPGRTGGVRAGRRRARPRPVPRARDGDGRRNAVRRARRDGARARRRPARRRPVPARRATARRRRDALAARPARPALARRGWRRTGSARCSPPAWLRACRPGAVNYLAGLAGIRPRAFYAAVALGALPKTIAYVTLGGALRDPLSARGAFAVALYVAAAAGGALVARRLVRLRPGAAPA